MAKKDGATKRSKQRTGLTRRSLARDKDAREESRVGEPQIGPRLKQAK